MQRYGLFFAKFRCFTFFMEATLFYLNKKKARLFISMENIVDNYCG